MNGRRCNHLPAPLKLTNEHFTHVLFHPYKNVSVRKQYLAFYHMNRLSTLISWHRRTERNWFLSAVRLVDTFSCGGGWERIESSAVEISVLSQKREMQSNSLSIQLNVPTHQPRVPETADGRRTCLRWSPWSLLASVYQSAPWRNNRDNTANN